MEQPFKICFRFLLLALVLEAVLVSGCSSGTYPLSSGCYSCPRGYSCAGSGAPVRCAAGTYSDFGASSCTACPAGFACSDPTEIPTPCTFGQYAAAGSSYCLTCPAGYYCPTPDTATACVLGTNYCLGGTYNAISCPAGYACSSTKAAPVACKLGTYAAAGATSCTLCEAGYFCPHPSLSKGTCPSGYFSIAGSTSCTACPAYHSCSSTTALPAPCSLGQYAPPMSTSCTACPAGFYCDRTNNPGGIPIICADGYYSSTSAVVCSVCPSGSECPQKVASACSSGYYSTGYTSLCTKCPAGYFCATTSNPPSPCPAGTYAAAGATSCTDCAVGYFCPLPELGASLPCPIGTYQPKAKQTTCITCIGGSTCTAEAKSTFTQCSDGQYFNGLSGCLSCPAGYYCPHPDQASVIPCPSGFYSTGSAKYCTICTPGTYCTDGTSSSSCAAGTFSDYAALYCTPCPLGYECKGGVLGFQALKCPPGFFVNSGACTACTAGYMCPYPEFGKISCPTGTFTNLAGMVTCNPCPAGYACSSVSSAPTACSTGYYSYLYQGSCTACEYNYACRNGYKFDCPLNYYSTGSATDCLACPDGNLCLRNNPILGTVCSTGEYSTASEYTWRMCPPGYYCSGCKADTCDVDTYAPDEGGASCKACPAGFYAPKGSAACYPCPPGYSCSSGTYTKCPEGKYSLLGGGTCLTGTPGFIYTRYGEEALPALMLAPKGTYTQLNSNNQMEMYRCAAGTYNPKLGGTSSSDCLACPAGFYCPEGTGELSLYECPQGSYCPAGSYKPTECPADTYSLTKGLIHVDQCRKCPQGLYCGGASAVPTVCPMGYYCPIGPKVACPAGTYSGYRTGLRNIEECMLCPAGYYCPSGTDIPKTHITGYYNPWMGMSSTSDFIICPASQPCPDLGLAMYKGPPCARGYYCPAGTSTPTDNKCPEGTYSDSHYATSKYDCLACPPGYGCVAGSKFSDITACKAGYYCPRGTVAYDAVPCPAGTYRSSTGAKRLEDCLPCPNGYYCTAGCNHAGDNCPAGYYCPLGTKSPTQYPCPAGTYSPTGVTNLKEAEDCLLCGFGSYCIGAGQTTPTTCASGYYNDYDKSSSSCTKCPAGKQCSDPTAPALCLEGTYSDSGANACTTCEIGYYCPLKGITKAQKLSSYACPAGMFCSTTGAVGGNGLAIYPNLDTHGCPAGYYCPAGATAPQACPAGTYNPVRGRGSLSDCLTTPAGYWTASAADNYKSTPCDPGYFCLAGSSDSKQYPCPAGSFRALSNGASPAECSICPAGYYCLEGTYSPADCPMGFYCPMGTVKPESCPEGTYSDVKNLFDSKACKSCTAGRYCYMRNMTDPSAYPCDAGFYCISGSKRPEPLDGITGNLCPKGGYCPSGVSVPLACDAGYLMVISGASLKSQCVLCPPGYYCTGTNSADPDGPCDAGYYCSAGSSSRTQNEAQEGYYAPAGSQFPLKCPRGTYNTQKHSASCDECDPGTFCGSVGMTSKPLCSKGYYCPSKSWAEAHSVSYDMLPCPVGTYNEYTGKSSLDDCMPCTLGYYCDKPGMDAPGGKCDAGYYCLSNSPYQRPPTESSGNYGPCPAGSYCPQGTANPIPCPEGTYSSSTMLTADTECLTCYEGKYCQGTGQTTPTGDCAEGYYCPAGTTVPSPPSTYCAIGQYCPAGSGSPVVCPPGFYQSQPYQGRCQECPKGAYCSHGGLADCPAGFYCP